MFIRFILQRLKSIFFSFLLIFCAAVSSQNIFEMMNQDGVNLKEIQAEAELYFDTNGKGPGSGYKLFKRWESNAIKTLQLDGTLQSNQSVAGSIKKKREKFFYTNKSTLSDWVELGPLAVTGFTGNPAALGRITAIAVEPTNHQLIYVGSPGGGLWKSINAGNSWTPIGDQFDNMNIFALELDPNDSNTIYYGDDFGDLFKSIDGGSTFDLVRDGSGVLSDILVNPNNSNEIFVVNKLFSSSTTRGISHSLDGGNSWTQVLNVRNLEDIMYKPGTTDTVYACGQSFYRSIDGGSSFIPFTSGIRSSDRMKMAVTPANNNYVYLVQTNRAGGFGNLYKSVNSGNNFTIESDASDDNYIGFQGHRDMAITVSSTDEKKLHIAGLDTWVSDDAGKTFTQQTIDFPTLLYPVHRDIEVLLTIDSIIYMGNDGGIYRSMDGGETFHLISVGLGIQQFYALGNSASNKNMILAGSQDNGTALMSGIPASWRKISGGDGMDCMIHPTDERIMYTSSQNGVLFRTEDAGLIGSLISPTDNLGAWTTPFVMDPSNSNVIYAGYRNLYRHDNGGIGDRFSSWVNTSSNFNFGSNLLVVEPCPSNNNTMYVSSAIQGVIYKSSDILSSSPTWKTLRISLSASVVNDIAVDPDDENRIVVSTSNRKIYLSTDGGDNWQDVKGNLPDLPVKTIVMDRSSDNGVYVGLLGAIYFKNDKMADWIPFENNLPNVDVRDLAIYYGAVGESRLRVATYGRGVWESPLYDDVDVVTSVSDKIHDAVANEGSNVLVFPNPVSEDYINVQLQTEGEDVTISIINSIGEKVSEKTFETTARLNLLKINVEEFAAGNYIVNILKGQTRFIERLVIQK